MADFGLSREVVKSRIDTDSFGTITHTPPELLREGCAPDAGSFYCSFLPHEHGHVGPRQLHSLSGRFDPQLRQLMQFSAQCTLSLVRTGA